MKAVAGETVAGSNPVLSAKINKQLLIYNADVIQLVECNLAKVDVASSSLVIRSVYFNVKVNNNGE